MRARESREAPKTLPRRRKRTVPELSVDELRAQLFEMLTLNGFQPELGQFELTREDGPHRFEGLFVPGGIFVMPKTLERHRDEAARTEDCEIHNAFSFDGWAVMFATEDMVNRADYRNE